MIRYKRLLVSLGLNDHDRALIRYAGLVSRMARSEEVRFAHVFRAPRSVEVHFEEPSFKNPLRGVAHILKEDVQTEVDEQFEGPPGTLVRSMIEAGTPLTELLRIARDAACDLVAVGRDAGAGLLAEKLARKAPCSVLIVPTGAPPAIRRILVPVDFSEHAADAVDVAVAFGEAAGLEELHLVHVYSSPPSSYFGLFTEEADLLEEAQQAAEAFLSDLDLRGLEPVLHFVEHANVAQAVTEQEDALEADLVVMGTHGRTDSAAILLGSVAEQLVHRAQVPLIAVKRKGATLTLLDALFGRSTETENPSTLSANGALPPTAADP